uniref:Uncharacterized protein n=1 Tax=Moniliophthora roreri TaxID=221103 RepID=A0A0W0FQH3_MONRR
MHFVAVALLRGMGKTTQNRDLASIFGLVSTTIIIRITLSSDNMESTVGLSRATNIENNAAAVIDISRSATGLKQEEASE